MNRLRDHALIGLLFGLISPAILGGFALYLMKNIIAFKQADLLLIACVAINLYWVKLFYKLNKDFAAKGVIGASFLYAFLFFIYKTMQEAG
jgi:hypothetical protein